MDWGKAGRASWIVATWPYRTWRVFRDPRATTGKKWAYGAGAGAWALTALIVVGAVAGDSGEKESPEARRIAATATTVRTMSAASPDVPAGWEVAKVTRVIDGDTFEISLKGKKDTVRLIGIDTPETVDPRRPDGCFGKEASDYAKQLLKDQDVHLEKDVSDRDRSKRLLRYAYLMDQTQINALLVQEGYARATTFPPDVKFADRYRELEGEAREANKGLWGPICATPEPTASPVPTQPPAVATRIVTQAPAPPAPVVTQAPSVYYPNCAAVRAAGAAPIRRGQPGYGSHLDGDGDGIGCER